MPEIHVLETDVLIHAPSARVWALMHDPRRLPEWSPQVRSTTLLDGAEEIAVGVRFVNDNAQSGLSWTTHCEVVRYLPGTELAFRVDENWLIWSFTLKADGAGKTRVIQRREAPEGISDYAHGLTEKYMGGTIAFNQTMFEGMSQTLLRMKEACERGIEKTSIPELRTARLCLDLPKTEDSVQILEIAGNPRTVEHNPSDFLTGIPDAEALVNRWIRHWEFYGYGYWCVREKDQSRIVGYCGVKNMTVQGHSVLNLICRLRPEVWGRGYGTEATQTVLDWAQRTHPNRTLLARIRPKNSASRKVALKAGLMRDPILDEDGEDGLDLSFSTRRNSSGSTYA
ncbi:GNAT family N-acetyltransferase [Brevibacterium aurantiacum]|uniref:GNAT family N-acetyltransferase n=1 Tax=Brevibacterium aurantiacum TaxID=273384 RepID=UPI001436B031|nr:GNAT family N-acetyltransferase [Brevibacterium aurantiacum]